MDWSSRVRSAELASKVMDPYEAVKKFIPRRGVIAFAGMVGTAIPKEVPVALSRYSKETSEEEGMRTPTSPLEKSPEEEVLTTYKKRTRKELGHTYAKPSFVELRDDGSGIFKTIQCKNERAAYLIDRFLGFNLVPTTVIRMLDGKEGSMQKFIPGAKTGSETKHKTLQKEQIKKRMLAMRVFDVIIQNTDRNSGNYLIKKDQVWAIDHGLTCGEGEAIRVSPDAYELDRWLDGGDYPDDVVEKLENFQKWTEGRGILLELLAELLGKEKAEKLIQRMEAVAKMVVMKKKPDASSMAEVMT